MWKLIISIVLLLILAIIVSYNAGSTAQIRLPGFQSDSASVVAIAMVSFALGVIYSFLLYTLARLDRHRSERLKKKRKKLADQEDALEEREDALDDREDEIENEEKTTDPGAKGGFLKGFRKRWQKSAGKRP